METKKLLYNAIKIVLPLVLGGGILYWMYRDFDFAQMRQVVLNEMNWTWMLLSMPFGILAQTFRGWRWKQVLEPLDEQTRNSVCVNSIFLSYAVSLVIPRVGEFARCGVLSRYDNVAFPKALGTVVTERAVDIVIVILMAVFAILTQIKVFTNFFFKTGTNIDNIVHKFSMTGWFVTGICAIAVIILLYI
ncbi:MAG: flippase-like domain-containing protein, partial [Prevotella pallens]|nr:flippase-like domain-containing protein [Prevotella pallens]